MYLLAAWLYACLFGILLPCGELEESVSKHHNPHRSLECLTGLCLNTLIICQSQTKHVESVQRPFISQNNEVVDFDCIGYGSLFCTNYKIGAISISYFFLLVDI